MNKEKYADRTLSDEQIEHEIDYSEMYRISSGFMMIVKAEEIYMMQKQSINILRKGFSAVYILKLNFYAKL